MFIFLSFKKQKTVESNKVFTGIKRNFPNLLRCCSVKFVLTMSLWLFVSMIWNTVKLYDLRLVYHSAKTYIHIFFGMRLD